MNEKARQRSKERIETKLEIYKDKTMPGLTLPPSSVLHKMSFEELAAWVDEKLGRTNLVNPKLSSISPPDVTDEELVLMCALKKKKVKGRLVSFRTVERTLKWRTRNGKDVEEFLKGQDKKRPALKLWKEHRHKERMAVLA